jgi:hypothetical protein
MVEESTIKEAGITSNLIEHRRQTHDRELRDVVVAVGLMGLAGFMFWIIAGGLLVLLGSPWLEP